MSHDNTRLLCHLLDQSAKKEEPAVMIALDAEKAFDRVSWAFLEQCMRAYSLGDAYMRMVMALYRCPKARVVVNGGSQKPSTYSAEHVSVAHYPPPCSCWH